MENTINIENLNKKYKDLTIVKSINMFVNKGEIYGLLGRNGAGKTTIMKIILGLTKPTSGKVTVLGKDTSTVVGKDVLKKVGCIIETPGFYSNLTGAENLKIFAKLRNIDENLVKEVLELVNLSYNDRKLFSKYSLGMKQRLAIANAIMHKPEVLILDEPINGLDPIGIAEVRNLFKMFRQSGTSILISSHILSELENLADRIGIINDGNLIDEIDMVKWHAQNNGFIKIYAEDKEAVVKALFSVGLKEYELEITSNEIVVKAKNVTVSELSKIFANNNVDISGIIENKTTLEDYFKKATGGQGIG